MTLRSVPRQAVRQKGGPDSRDVRAAASGRPTTMNPWETLGHMDPGGTGPNWIPIADESTLTIPVTRAVGVLRTRPVRPTGSGRRPHGPAGGGPLPTFPSDSRS